MPIEKKSAAHEHDHVVKEEAEFRIVARRNRLLGHWAAEKLGLTGDAAESYATEVVVVDLEAPGDEEVVLKLTTDLAAAGIATADGEIRAAMDRCFETARREVEGAGA